MLDSGSALILSCDPKFLLIPIRIQFPLNPSQLHHLVSRGSGWPCSVLPSQGYLYSEQLLKKESLPSEQRQAGKRLRPPAGGPSPNAACCVQEPPAVVVAGLLSHCAGWIRSGEIARKRLYRLPYCWVTDAPLFLARSLGLLPVPKRLW